jgi:predicted lipoprotein with Yx(FWY)xxD motif
MKKISLALILAASTLIAPNSAYAASQVKYTNQKEGQFCKTAEVGKYTYNPEGDRLVCISGESKARWQYKPLSVKYVAQKAGQFCKKTDLNKFTVEESGARLFCRTVDGRARWVQE